MSFDLFVRNTTAVEVRPGGRLRYAKDAEADALAMETSSSSSGIRLLNLYGVTEVRLFIRRGLSCFCPLVSDKRLIRVEGLSGVV